MSSLFVSGTGTNVGKTLVGRGLARAATRASHRTAALKPIETGCDPHPLDAIALAKACGHPSLAFAPGFYRARAALAPYAATLGGEAPPPSLEHLVDSVHQAADTFHVKLVEGAGGLFTPIDEVHRIADLVGALGIPLLLVARDELGSLSQVIAAHLAGASVGVRATAVVLTHAGERFPQNAEILRTHLGRSVPVFSFDISHADDDALANECEREGLTQKLLGL